MLTLQAIGNLGADPEDKTTERGMRYCRFSLATNKKVKGEKVTTWINCTVFDEKKIEFIMAYVRKGTKLFIEGEPSARAYESNGEARASLDVILGFGSKIEICTSEPRDDAGGDRYGGMADAPVASSKPSNEDLNDDIPW